VVGTQVHTTGSTVVEVWEGDFVLCPYLVTDNNLVDVVKLIPVFVVLELVSVKGFEFGSTRNGHIKSFGSVETFLVE
jgi:hypothetical protein